jgi:hypothetical protein
MFLVTLVKENCGVYPIIQKHLPIRTDLWDGFHCWLYYGLPTIPRYKECICWLICLDTLTKKSKKNVLLVYYVILKYVSWTPRQGQAFFLRRAIFVFFFFNCLFSSLALWLLWVCGFCGFTMLYLSIYPSIYLSNLT